ncbi:hypothetical protein RRG08_022793 [Elysia crispata]|uniref:Uncharacterized protein n=1 Tax=Elysia crispata TaxID=231223 RepID=A0AAE0Z073_9GAST|nr:hypothetical protein RRG08_022793 [Elysia crispata]
MAENGQGETNGSASNLASEGDNSSTRSSVKHLIEHVTDSRIAHQVREVLNRCSSSTEDEVKRFLAEEHDFNSLQPPLSSLGLNRLHLLGYQKLEECSMMGKTMSAYQASNHFGVDKKSLLRRARSEIPVNAHCGRTTVISSGRE